jgi:hypothetical protein
VELLGDGDEGGDGEKADGVLVVGRELSVDGDHFREEEGVMVDKVLGERLAQTSRRGEVSFLPAICSRGSKGMAKETGGVDRRRTPSPLAAALRTIGVSSPQSPAKSFLISSLTGSEAVP